MSRTRIPWIDAARGLAVLLVVVFHLLIWNHETLTQSDSALTPFWNQMEYITGRIRMPLLMALSGLLAYSAIDSGWRRVRVRVAANYYLYLVWLALYLLFYKVLFVLVPGRTFPMQINSFTAFFTNLLLPSTVLWFILALAVFPLVVWLLRRGGLNWPLVNLFAFTVWLYGVYGEMPDTIGKLARTFIFFTIGASAHAIIKKLPETRIVGAVAMVTGLLIAAYNLPKMLDYQLAFFLTAIAGLVTAATVMPLVTRVNGIAKVGGYVGRRSVEIYLMHLPLLALMSIYTNTRPRWLVSLTSTGWGDALYVVGSAAIVVAVCLLLGAAIRRIPGNPLLGFPWKARMERGRTETVASASADQSGNEVRLSRPVDVDR